MPKVTQTASAAPYSAANPAEEQQRGPVQLRQADYASGASMMAPVQLKRVTNGPDLEAVQQQLNALGFECGTADGKWGPKTQRAVIAFQRSCDLTADGIIGANTLNALDRAAGAKPSTPGATTPATPKPGPPGKSEAKPAAPEAKTEEPDPSAAKTDAPKEPAKPDGGGDAAPEADEVKSEGDRLREAIAGSAEGLKGKEFMSQEEIESVRERTGLKNYTTCIDFAGKTMREGVGEVYGTDYKKAQKTAVMLSEIKGNWDKEVGAKAQAAGYQKAVDRYDKAIGELQQKKDKVLGEIAELRRPAEPGESELALKQRNKRADILEKQAVGAYDRAIKKLEGHRARFQAKIDKKTDQAAELAANNSAMIKTEPGMKNGRPKVGEYVMLAQVPGGAKYGVSKDTQVHLAGGTFKHIAIHMDHKDIGGGVEEWTTIDGGGTSGKQSMLYVQTSSGLVYRTPTIKEPEPGKPWTGSRPSFHLAGWIDMDKLIAMRDAKG